LDKAIDKLEPVIIDTESTDSTVVTEVTDTFTGSGDILGPTDSATGTAIADKKCDFVLADWKSPYKDMPDSDSGKWYFPHIAHATYHKIFKGDADGNFKPAKQIDRGEMVSLLCNLEEFYTGKRPTPAFEQLFTDIEAGKWYTDALVWSVKNEIVKVEGETFDIAKLVSREDMALWMYNFVMLKGGEGYKLPVLDARKDATIDVFGDADKIGAKEIVLALYKAGVFKGDDEGNFKPGEAAERAEVATIFVNFLTYVASDR